MEKLKALAELIEKNPNCLFQIDNDGWYITDQSGENIIGDSSDYYFNCNWYGDSNTYGAGLALAMIEILNKRGFNIKSSSV